MKGNCWLLVIVLVLSIILCHVAADSEGVSGDRNTDHGSNGSVKDPVDTEIKGKDGELGKNDPKGNELKKTGDGVQSNGLDTKPKKEAKEELLSSVRGKCDSQSNRCIDDDKTFVACLRVPGNESPALSLLIQNKGRGSRSITISASKLVKLQKNQIELQENQDTEVTVSISSLESDPFIELESGHGNCSLNFTEQYLALKKANHSSESASVNIFKLTIFRGFLAVFALVTVAVAVSVLMYTKLGRKFSRTGPKYQMLDMEIPVPHNSELQPGKNEGWNDSWEDNWDDEEAPMTPSMLVTPSLSINHMASRKFSKDGWND